MSSDGQKARIERLSPAKRQLFEQLQKLREQGNKLAPRLRDVDCPISLAQEGLWFVEQLSRGSAAFNVPAAFRIEGRVDAAALQRSIDALVTRHEVLRMRFGIAGGRPYAVFDEAARVELEHIEADASGVTAVIDRLVRTPFELLEDRLIRATLIDLGGEKSVLVIVAHHSICDGRSIELFFAELQQAYAEHAGRGVGSEPRQGPLQYGDYATWERQALANDGFSSESEYWRSALADGCPELVLPVRGASSVELTKRSASSVRVDIPASLYAALRAVASANTATPFMVLLALWKLVFFAWSGQKVLVVGMPVANRVRPEVQDILGMFTNTVVIRSVLGDDQTFEQLLSQLRGRVLEGIEHQAMPFSKVVEMLAPSRAAGEIPLVRATVWLKSRGAYALDLPGVKTTALEVEPPIANYDFSVVMLEEDQGLRTTITFPEGLFEAAIVKDMGEAFVALAREIAKSTTRSLSSYVATVQALQSKLPEEELTKNQLLVWMGQKLHGEGTIYNEALSCLVRGRVDESRFELAWKSVVESSDVLRGRITLRAGVPKMELGAADAAAWSFVDLSASHEPEVEWQKLVQSELRRPWDLGRGCCRVTFARLGPELYGFCLGLHHIATDAWSFGQLFQRLQKALESNLGEYPQFQAFARQDREFQDGPAGATAKTYWEKKLARRLDTLSFYGRPADGRSVGVTRLELPLTEGQETALVALAQKKEFASFSLDQSLMGLSLTLLSAYILRVSAARAFSIGVPFHNRTSASLSQTVGLLMSVCPLHVEATERDTFRTVYQTVMREVRACLPHTRSVIPNPPDRPTYSVMLNYQNREFGTLAGFPTEVEMLTGAQELEALTVQVVRGTGGRLRFFLDLNETVFPAQIRDRVLGHWQRLLDALLADPEQTIGAVDMLTPEERRLFAEAHANDRAVPEVVSVVELVRRSVLRNPDAIAAVDGALQLSYRALWRGVEHFAFHLRERGFSRESLVALCLSPGSNNLVAMLGVLRAGCAYLALHPDDPPARRSELMEQAGATIVFGEDEVKAVLAQPPAAPVDVLLHPEQAAYVLFTSGSTGRPKGVVVTHRALSGFVHNARKYLALSSQDRVLQFATPSFDTSVEEIFPTLIDGGTLVVRSESLLDTPGAFLETVREQALTVVDLPTSVWHMLASALSSSETSVPDCVRTIVIGGEQAHAVAWQRWSDAVRAGSSPSRAPRVLNTYGPTETTVVVSALETTLGGSLDRGESVPIGHALGGVWLSTLDVKLEQTPVSVPGELYVGGYSLARGYHRQPALTAERFVPHPKPESAGERVYRTGDWAHLNEHGEWVYAGRHDRQIKFNGYRIELDEIEKKLHSIPGVQAAAVYRTARGDFAASYVCGELRPSAVDVRHALGEMLPRFMIPLAISEVEGLPRDARGKIDYSSLSTSTVALTTSTRDQLQPRTPEEQTIAGTWTELLSLEPGTFGVLDNFFQLGGHSLLGTQLMARLEKEFGVALPLKLLFETPTVAGLADAVVRLAPTAGEKDELDDLVSELEGLSQEELDELLGVE